MTEVGDRSELYGSARFSEKQENYTERVLQRETEAWSDVLGTSITLPDPPETVRNLAQRFIDDKDHVGIRAIPPLDIGTLDQLCSMGTKKFLQRLQDRYPGIYTTYNVPYTHDPLTREWPCDAYWESIIDNRAVFPDVKEGSWMLVETMPKPHNSQFNDLPDPIGTTMQEVLNLMGCTEEPVPDRHYDPSLFSKYLRLRRVRQDALIVQPTLQYVKVVTENRRCTFGHVLERISYATPHILHDLNLPDSTEVRLLQTLEYNLLTNRHGWEGNRGDEWIADSYISHSDDVEVPVCVGNFGGGGSGAAPWSPILPEKINKLKAGFRLAVILS